MSFDFDRYYREVDETLRKHGVPVEPMQMEINPVPEEPEPQVTPEEQYNHVEAPEWKDVSVLQSPLREVAGSVYNIVEGRAPHNEQLQAAAKDAMEDVDIEAINPEAPEENPGVDPEIQAQNEQGNFTPFKAAIEETAEDKNAFFSEQASAIRASSVYREYFYTQPEKLAQARKMAAATGITVDSFINDPKAYTEVQHIYDELKKGQAVVGEKNFSMKNIYAMYPELNGIADMDDEQITLALHDIDNVHRVSGVIENAKTMWEQGKKQTELNKRYYKIYKGTASQKEAEETEAMYREMNNPLNVKMAPYFMEHPFEYAVATAAQSLPMMLEDTKGSIIGGAAAATMAVGAAVLSTAATGGTMTIPAMMAAASFGWKAGSFIGGTGALAEMSIGEAYAEKAHKTDENGKPLYTHEEIKPVATAEGMINAILEHFEYGTVRGAFASKAKVQKKAMQETTAVIFEQAKSSASLRSTFDKLIKERLGTFAKATLEESGEEAMQSFNTDIMNNILVYNTGKGEYVSAYDMARNAKDSYLEALPASAAMTGATAGAGAMTSAPAIGRQLAHASAIGQYNEQSQQTIVGMNLLANLQAAVTDSKLKDLAPDVQQMIIRNEAKDSDFKLVYIDTASALQKENGRDSLQKVADAAGYDSDTLQTAIEQGNLIVPLEVYAQSEADPDLLSSVSFSKEAPSIEKMKRDIQETFTRQNEMMKETIERQKKLMDQITAEYFPNDKEGSDMAAAAIYENAANPAQGLKTIEKRLLDERDTILKPAMDALARGGDEEWRKNFRETFKREPNEKELRNMATDLMSGFDSAPEIDGWSIDPETSTDVRDKLAAIDGRLAIIDRTKEKISTLTNAEIKLTEGMTPEAFSAYRTLFSELAKGPGTSSRAARMNAILFARHADKFARVISDKTGRKYTAKDYYKERFALGFNGQQQADSFNQQVVAQSEAVRKQYEGTDQWMKAPNGQPTNLTEEQWLAVRTPAFKEWFGDWEIYAKAVMPDGTANIDKAKSVIESLRSSVLVSNDENIKAQISKDGRKKLISAAATRKSIGNGFSADEHFLAVSNLERLFSNSVRSHTKADRAGELEAIENFSAPIVIRGKIALATFTVKVTKNSTTGRSIYSIEVMELKKSEGILPNQIEKSVSASSDFDTLNISKIAEKINSCSKVVDENGEPKVVYHVTDADFNTFDIGKARQNSDIPAAFFSSGTDDWADMGSTAMPAFLNIRNITEKPIVRGEGAKVLQGLKDAGYDGTILEEDGMETEYAAFYPEQIKSATGNNGNFDVNDPNIYHQILGEKGAAELDRQEEVTTRLDNLAVARQMEEAGKDAQAIKLATGWERGADKLWRYEIPDIKIKSSPTWEIVEDGGKTYHVGTLADLVFAPALFKAYPQLKDVTVHTGLFGWGNIGSYNPAINMISINNDYEDRVENEDRTRRLRELEATPEYQEYTKGRDVIIDREITTLEEEEAWEKELIEYNNEFYKTHVGNAYKQTLELPRYLPGLSGFVRNILAHEIQHAIQDIEGFARGSSVEEFTTDDNAAARDLAVGELQDKINRQAASIAKGLLDGAGIEDDSLIPNIVEALVTTDKTLEEIVSDFNLPEGALWHVPKDIYSMLFVDSKEKLAKTKDKYNPVNRYKRSMGEVESRNVETRMSMPWEERQKTLLKDTEDVAREDQIFLRNGANMAIANAISVEENIKNGKAAINKVMETKSDVDAAMFRPEVGAIDFIYGAVGDPNKKFKGGYGLAKILAKHGQEALDAIPEVLAKGKAYQKYPDRVYFVHDKYLSVVRLDFDGKAKVWLVTNYEQTEKEIKNDPDLAEVFARSANTANNPNSVAGGGSFNESVLLTNNNVNPSETYFQSAWHGTPHYFDTFDLGAIGTGEGQAAHGWGLYFAKNKATAEENYRDILGDKEATINGDIYRLEPADNTVYKNGKKMKLSKKSVAIAAIINWKGDIAKALAVSDTATAKEIKQLAGHAGTIPVKTLGSLFEVDIPEDSVMLNEWLTYEEQPEAVKDALSEIFPFNDEIQGKTGFGIYKLISQQYGGDRAASLALNEVGIKGIKYGGLRDGICYVVFDDKAISVINKYNQEANSKIKGSFSPLSNGQRLIQLFSTADESTFLHEMGHLFLTDLEDLAQIDEVSAKELATVREWATWKKGDSRKYQGTPWSKEFSDLEKSIIAAEEAGDTITAEAQKRRWTQERFARGFEIYLKDGKAPAKGLQAVFRKFASFLRQIYTAFISDGARASADVEAIMARMIATDEEIEAMALDDQFKDIEKAGGEKLLNESERETYERWLNEAKEEAKEKLQKIVMADLTEKKRQEMLQLKKEERAKEYERLEQEPIYLARAIIDKLGGSVEEAMPVILDHCFPDRESFEAADKAAPPIDEAVQQHLEDWQRDYDEQNRKEISEEEVREAMESSVYHRKAKAMESAALSRKLDAKRKITGKVDKAIQNINDAIDSMPEDTDLKVDKYTKRVKTLIQKVNELRFSTRWNSNDFQHLDRMLKSTTPAEMKELLADFVKNMQQQKLNINDVEKANEGRLKMYAEMARKAAEDKPIYNATNSGEYRRNQRKAESRVLQMIKAGRFELALQQSQHAALSAAMAKEAEKTKEEVDKLIAHINQQLSAKTVKLPAKERYWHKHIAYLLGIGLNDANKPVLPEGQQLGTLQDLLNGYKDRLDLAKDYNADEVLEFITGTAAQQSYVALTVDQLRQAVQLLNIIYKCGKDEFELKTVRGMTIESVVKEVLKDEVALAKQMRIQKRRIQDNIGGLGYNGWLNKIPTVGDALAKAGQDYLVIGLKPEKVIELLGKTAYKYIFGTFDEAASREADMMAKATTDVQNLLKEYSHQERRDWKKRTYTLHLMPGEEVELTKENIICMALNLGTEINRKRLFGGLIGPIYNEAGAAYTQNTISFLEDNMTKKDWLFVQSVWDYLHTYWEDTVRIEQELNGMQLQAQPPVPFSVTVDGERLDLAGGYYPIDYNPDKNDRSSVQAQDDVAKQMGGSAKVLGTGRSHTKSRTEAEVFRELQLTFDIVPKHLSQVIHNITTRIAARDVYRLLNHKELSQHITDRLGSPVLDMLRKWALDVWTQLPEKDMAANVLEKAIGALRRNSTFAIMAYRIWPVIENSSNYAVLADKMGAVNALSALSDFYGNIEEHRLLLNKSSMMRNRLNNLDRDIRSTPGLFNADHPAIEMIREHGYDLMTYSDLMFSAPLWCRAYKDVFHETLEEVNKENIANKAKVQEAQNKLDKLRGEHLQTDEDIKDWYAERRNRKNAGQVGWQPGTSRFAVMGHQEFTEQLEELKNQKDELGLKIWEAEAEFGRAIELKILDDAEVVREAEHRAAMKADAVVRDGFGSGRTVDLPAVQRSYSELVKAMTSFYSFFNTVFNSIYFSYIQSRYGNRPTPNAGTWDRAKQWAPLARTVMYRIFLLSAIGSVLKMATKTDGDDDRDKYHKVIKDGKEVKEEIPWLQRFLKVFAKNSLGTATGSLYGVRDLANVAMNLAFDGTDFGRGVNIVSTPLRSVEEGIRTIKLIAAKSERDAKIEARKQQEAAKLKKMTAKQRRKYLEEQKYKKPLYPITYTEIFRHAANAITGFTATKTGVSSTVIDSVTGTMQYLLDTDNRYDATWRNIIWSAIFDKKPVEKTPPEKPEKKKQKKPRQ